MCGEYIRGKNEPVSNVLKKVEIFQDLPDDVFVLILSGCSSVMGCKEALRSACVHDIVFH